MVGTGGVYGAPARSHDSSPPGGAQAAAILYSNLNIMFKSGGRAMPTTSTSPTGGTTSSTERDLLLRAGAGDAACFGRLYDLTVADVWRTIRCAGAGQAEAERAVVTAYVELWTRAADPEVAAHPRRWLMGHAYRAVRGHERAA